MSHKLDIGEYIFRQCRKACRDYNLIDNGDRILVGLSGGKDSMALIEMLGRMSWCKKPEFSVKAAFISMEHIDYQSNTDKLAEYCNSYGIEFIHRKTCFDKEHGSKKQPCFVCSWIRRKELFSIAKEFSCNKLALGHNRDDILETFLLNTTFLGNISSMPPSLKMNKFDLTIVRPLYLVAEKNLEELAIVRQFVKPEKRCPYEKESHRTEMKELLKSLRAINPEADKSILTSLSHVLPDYLPPQKKANIIRSTLSENLKEE